MKRTTIVAAASLVFGALLVSACSSKQEPQPAYPTQNYAPNAYPGAAPANPGYAAPAAAPGAAPVAVDPNAAAYPQGTYPPAAAPAPAAVPAAPAAAPAAPAAGMIDQGAALAIKVPIAARATTEAKGMKEDGPVIAGMLQEGATLTQEFTLNPGRCYTIIGQGLPAISQLDLQLAVKPMLPNAPPMVLAASSTQGPNATIASGKNCYKNALPVATPVVLTAKASRGSGVVGAQVYSK